MKFRTLISLFILSLVLGISACESPEQTPAEGAASDAAEQAVADGAEKATDTPELASVEESVIDESESVAEEAIELTAPIAADASEADWQYEEGQHFRRLTTSQGTSSAPDKIEVAEIFWYGCPHCYDFEPIIGEWRNRAPADISVVKIPVIWNPTNQIHARIMYTAEALGVREKIHPAVFDSIHQKNVMLTTDEEIVALFKNAGVDEATFREAYGSFGVTSALKRAENLTRRYGIRSVPIIVVNGKYVVEGEGIRSFADTLAVTTELTERERRNR
jgi:thiol:disulfide interchange protein DsbA